MTLFTRIDEAQAIVKRKGIYKQCPLYERDNNVYAGLGGGFIRLMSHGSTTAPDVLWDEVFDPRQELVKLTPGGAPKLRLDKPRDPLYLGDASCPGAKPG